MEDYDYELPADRIADRPLTQRDDSRLLVLKDGRLESGHFRFLPSFLQKDSLLVLNNTRVVQARLLFKKPGGARIEVFCLRPEDEGQDMQVALRERSPVSWLCLVGNAKKWKQGVLDTLNPHPSLRLTAEKKAVFGDAYLVTFSWTPSDMSFGEVLEEAGLTPLPPYIQRPAASQDRKWYQTAYARHAGSVAAPTAGLHFTEEVFSALQAKGIPSRFLTLHVGAGTFKPVSSDTIGGHRMHQESFAVERSLLSDLAKAGKRPVVCVGTTSMRTLESLYWLGCLMEQGLYRPRRDGLVQLDQWAPYGMKADLPPEAAFSRLLHYMDGEGMDRLLGETSLIIVPGYPFRVTDVLLTNFHLPRSTLLLLLAAFAGSDWRNMYAHALAHGFRFLSYGDACLIFRQKAIF